MASILAYFHDRQDVTKDRVAIVIMSGGKDSRIGGQIPKGALDVGLLSHKSIFQLYIERIRRLQHLVQRKFKKAVYIPVYIMCNRDNKEIIEDFFRENEFFGIREQDVLFFTQGDYPICDKRGKYLLEEKHKIAVNPNGNGGIFRALVEEGMVSDMKSRGVTSIYVPWTAKRVIPTYMQVGQACLMIAPELTGLQHRQRPGEGRRSSFYRLLRYLQGAGPPKSCRCDRAWKPELERPMQASRPWRRCFQRCSGVARADRSMCRLGCRQDPSAGAVWHLLFSALPGRLRRRGWGWQARLCFQGEGVCFGVLRDSRGQSRNSDFREAPNTFLCSMRT